MGIEIDARYLKEQMLRLVYFARAYEEGEPEVTDHEYDLLTKYLIRLEEEMPEIWKEALIPEFEDGSWKYTGSFYHITPRRFRVIIAGGREFKGDVAKTILEQKCNHTLQNKDFNRMEIVHGAARGADTLGADYGKDNLMLVTDFPANWDTYPKAAGPIRNTEMANYADALIAFWDGESKGTKHMIETAKKKGLLVRVIRYDRK